MTNPGAAMTDERLREAVIAACRALTQRGLTHGTSGNVSVRRDERCFFVSPTGIPYDALEPDDIPLIDLGGRWFGRRRPSSEWRFHRDIFTSRDEVAASSAPTANLTRRTLVSSLAAEIFPDRSSREDDCGE